MSVRRISVGRRSVWQARVAYKGVRKSTICQTKEDARHAEAALLQHLKKVAADDRRAKESSATVEMLFDAYATRLSVRGKSTDTIARVKQTERTFRALMPAFLRLNVGQVADVDIFDFRRARDQGGIKSSTINRDLRTLRAMLNLARPDYRFPPDAFVSEDENRVRWLRPEEEILLFEMMPSPFKEIAKLAALTLMRLSEARNLRREEVRLEQGVIMLPRAKAGPRAVVLSDAAQRLLLRQLAIHQESFVFPNRDGRPYTRVHISRVFRTAARAIGLTDFHFHDLRHHGATMALNKGFSASIVMDLGGWKTAKMMRRYAAITDVTLRAAAEAVSGTLSSLPNEPVIGVRPLRYGPPDGKR